MTTPSSKIVFNLRLPWVLGLLLASFLGGASVAAAHDAQEQTQAQRQKELRYLVRQDCGSCHGMRMSGGLGPPLTAAALTGKPQDMLVYTILEGRPGTAMPRWRPFLSEAEARWIVQELAAGGFDER